MKAFWNKYVPVSVIFARKAEMSRFAQNKKENLPQAWGRFSNMKRKCPGHGFSDHELLDIFYNGLTEESRSHLDSFSGNIFRQRTIFEAQELLPRPSSSRTSTASPKV